MKSLLIISVIEWTDTYPVAEPAVVCPEPNGVVRNPYDCHTYYQCRNNWPQLQSCPNGLLFDSIFEWCDEARYVTC
ncbi:unnamed protein product [Medioppia subpectinata]|uniref:Chitin-binding type-2 domain-containing protein n=1 Tax=Medioppia subpectinata TaxID=1979941 RepID=A0A7R9LT01_9ACAR|nr:unnamed protein product [Medioppia subpectinata]CAG2121433.1 unnamed protein product [Medioppia subpectinata]